MSKINKKELAEIVTETIYELLQENDEALISLMRAFEKMNGDIDENINEWVEKTTNILREDLNITPIEDSPSEIILETTRMLELSDINEVI